MNCQSAKNWLLQAETLESDSWPTKVVEHVKSCPACARLARKIRQLENAWSDQPVTEKAEDAKLVFLKKLRKRSTPVKTPGRGWSFWRSARWIAAAAAMLLVGVTIAALFLTPGQVQASDVVDRLVELNLELSSVDARERQRLLTENEAALREELRRVELTAEDRQFAEELLAAARTLAENDDPVEEATVISDLAEQLKTRAELASRAGNESEIKRCQELYKKADVGFKEVMNRINQYSKVPEGMKKPPPGFDSFKKYDPAKQQQLQKLVQPGSWGPGRAPDFRPQLDSLRKKGPGGALPSGGFGGFSGSGFKTSKGPSGNGIKR